MVSLYDHDGNGAFVSACLIWKSLATTCAACVHMPAVWILYGHVRFRRMAIWTHVCVRVYLYRRLKFRRVLRPHRPAVEWKGVHGRNRQGLQPSRRQSQRMHACTCICSCTRVRSCCYVIICVWIYICIM